MYGKVVGVSNVATGIALFPSIRASRILFAAAIILLASGVAIFLASTIVARKNR